MSIFEDDRPKKPLAAQPGEDLSALSIDELQARIALYHSEIDRLAAEIAAKETSRRAAESIFRTST